LGAGQAGLTSLAVQPRDDVLAPRATRRPYISVRIAGIGSNGRGPYVGLANSQVDAALRIQKTASDHAGRRRFPILIKERCPARVATVASGAGHPHLQQASVGVVANVQDNCKTCRRIPTARTSYGAHEQAESYPGIGGTSLGPLASPARIGTSVRSGRLSSDEIARANSAPLLPHPGSTRSRNVAVVSGASCALGPPELEQRRPTLRMPQAGRCWALSRERARS
jgi:hypothetical protein